ncbi:DUF1684 domain-containing protein [Arthrobacter monumenti]
MASASTVLYIADWRNRVFALYRQVRAIASSEPTRAHAYWWQERDELFRTHPASPLSDAAKSRFTGLNVAPYNPDARFECVIRESASAEMREIPTGTDGVVPFERIGTVELGGVGTLALWRLASYGGGLFLPLRDGLAGTPEGTYGGGRYLLDTAKGAHLGEGSKPGSIIVDLNFAYNPSCAYNEKWACPLPGPGNSLDEPLPYGELR